MNDINKISNEIYNDFFKFLAEKNDPLDAIHNSNKHFEYISNKKINDDEEEIKYKYLKEDKQNIRVIVKYLYRDFKCYITSLYLLIPKENFSVTQTSSNIFNITQEQEDFINEKLSSFVIVPIKVSKIVNNINIQKTIDFLYQLSYYSHIEDFNLLKDYMYIYNEDNSHLFVTFTTPEGELSQNLTILCDLNIEKNGFITKINNINLTYELILDNLFGFLSTKIFYNNNIVIDLNQLNNNDIEKLERIKKIMDVSEVIKSE